LQDYKIAEGFWGLVHNWSMTQNKHNLTGRPEQRQTTNLLCMKCLKLCSLVLLLLNLLLLEQLLLLLQLPLL
jgi:hypothetical protein